MAKIRLSPLLLVLAFLCFHSCVTSAKGIYRPKTGSRTLSKSRRYNLRKLAKYIKDSIRDAGESLKPKDQTPAPTNTEEVGFFVSFNVSKTPVTARMSISDAVTWLDNYQPSYSSTYQCCTENLTSCSAAICIGNNSYLSADTFIFQDGQLSNVPYNYNPGNETLSTTGFLSFSRSPYSILSIAQEETFSYFFSDFLNSNVTLGLAPSAIALQSTKIVTDPNYPSLYFVNLTQISIGSSSFKFGPTTNSSIVILDTVILPTLLETGVYVHVKSELMKLGRSFNDTDSGLEVCYNPNQIAWPNLTLFFPSDPPSSTGAQMVLTSNSYVINVQSGAECAAIFESEGGSLIGILAQINREMIFNISSSEPRVYFSQYPANDAAVLSKTMLSEILIWSLCVVLYLHVAV